jgi:diguanylate cyclase (GGDEF)-like protein
VIRRAVLSLVLSLAVMASADGDTLLRTDFEDGTASPWQAVGSASVGVTRYAGNASLRLDSGATAQTTVSTLGFTDVSVTLGFAASALGHGGRCSADVSVDGGRTWLVVHEIRAGADDCLEKRGFDARQLCRSVDMSIERGVARRQLLGLALRDPMTGLGNWAQFHESLTRATARAGRSGQLMALIYIDLDGFKQVNDALGHDAGDVLLKAVAARFSSQLRAGDLLARIGGDEFGLILENLTHAQCATVVARKLLASLEAPVLIGHEEVCVGASIGIAIRPADGLDAKDLLRAADSAMYLAKRQGGTRICSPSDLLSGAGATDLPRSALGEPMDATPQLRAVRPAEPERAQLG